MGHVNAQLTIKNLYDAKKAENGELHKDNIRQVTVNAMVSGIIFSRTTELVNQRFELKAPHER